MSQKVSKARTSGSLLPCSLAVARAWPTARESGSRATRRAGCRRSQASARARERARRSRSRACLPMTCRRNGRARSRAGRGSRPHRRPAAASRRPPDRAACRCVLATVIREDDAEAHAREGIDHRPLAQVRDRVREAVVQDHRRAIPALVLEVHASSVLTIRRVRHRSPQPRTACVGHRGGTRPQKIKPYSMAVGRSATSLGADAPIAGPAASALAPAGTTAVASARAAAIVMRSLRMVGFGCGAPARAGVLARRRRRWLSGARVGVSPGARVKGAVTVSRGR